MNFKLQQKIPVMTLRKRFKIIFLLNWELKMKYMRNKIIK